jgi:hypothetical protein
MHTVKNPKVRIFNRCRFLTLPVLNAVDFSRSRGRTRPACRLRRHYPGEAGLAQASLASRARSVKNFHRLISHGIVKNFEVQNLNSPQYKNFPVAPAYSLQGMA